MPPGRQAKGRAFRPAALALALAFAVVAIPGQAAAAGPSDLVAPFAGTQPGPRTFGGGHNFPGAALPFGMVQFSPDTTPSDQHSGGYDYRDNHLKGFSLTHLSGAGCALYGDFPFLPTTEPLRSSPAPHGSSGLAPRFRPGFSHAHETASPGSYSVRLNPAGGGAIGAQLSATTRTGLARFSFPSNPHSSVLINAGGSARANDQASVQINPGNREISGSASSGYFCAQRHRYKVYFAARFDRPFDAFGTWRRQSLDPGGTSTGDRKQPSVIPTRTAQAGAYATFDTSRDRIVRASVGISFISAGAARRNLAAENGGFSFARTAGRAERRWNGALGRVRVRGGKRHNLRTFYTALYHALLAPRTFEDADGRYIGMDGRVHSSPGYTQYADFSGWDIYRSEIQLLAMIAPRRAGDIVESLLADSSESGCLPRWPYANGQSMTMVGDPSDAIIASAAAFGADGFDTEAALDAMVRGATQPCSSPSGDYLERQGLDHYLRLGFLPYDVDVKKRNANSIFGSPESVWGSAATTLEYVTADFAIAQFAGRFAHDKRTYRAFMRRSGWWRRLFNRHSHKIEPRLSGGAFLRHYDNVRGGGFVEGNSYQYSWMIPHDPAGLFRAIGNRTAAARSLDRFLRRINGSVGATHTSHALLGNEPNLNVPWLYDWTRRPFKTQAAVRRALLRLYSPTPAGYPGNDDLGELSSWYVFGALGLYPEVPGVGLLAIGSPLFRHATVRLKGGRRLQIDAAGASAKAPYISGMRFNGHPYGRPWTTWCALAKGARLGFRLSPRPSREWGDSRAALPPSFGPRHPAPRHACTP
jgi:predicted alpha-1,2-mannosidase